MSQQAKPTGALTTRQDTKQLIGSEQFAVRLKGVLPSHITPERMQGIILTSVLRNPQILEGSSTAAGQASLFNACMIFAQAGIEPDGRMGHFVAFWSKEHNTYLVQAIFDWKGLVSLGLRNGMKSVYPDVVYENDHFDAYVENGVKKLVHKPRWNDRGEPLLVYCVAISKDDVLDYEIMTIEETEAIRNRSRAGKSGPWVTDTLEMRKKCPIRRMSKRWDLMPELRDAIYSDDDTPEDLPMTTPKFGPRNVAPKVEAEPPQPAPDPGCVEEILKKAAKSRIGQGALLEFIKGVCPVGDDCGTLEEAFQRAPDSVVMINEQWPDIAKRIHNAQAEEEATGGAS